MYIKFISSRCRPVQTRMQTGHCPDFATLQQCHRLCATFSANIKKINVMNTILWQGRCYLFQERQIYASSMGFHASYCRWHDLLMFFFLLWFKKFTEFCIAKFYESYIGKERRYYAIMNSKL